MKKLIFSLSLFLSFSSLVRAQWVQTGNNVNNTNPGVVNIGTTTATQGKFLVYTTGNYAGIFRGSTGGAVGLGSLNGVPFVQSATSELATTPAVLSINPAGGNVGIGTTTPQGTLHVNGVSIFSGNSANLDNRNNTVGLNFLANSSQLLIGWNRTQSNGETDFIANQGGGNVGGFAFYNHDNSNNENQLLYIQGNGNVAIGTSDPKGYKLAVNGSAIATSMTVKLNSAWPDYVFKKDYHLPSLQEVKAYIDQNQHLPEIPSEQQIAKEGLNLGEMNKLLMKKVEEMTLYLIEKDKQAQKQQGEIDELKAQMKKLIKP